MRLLFRGFPDFFCRGSRRFCYGGCFSVGQQFVLRWSSILGRRRCCLRQASLQRGPSRQRLLCFGFWCWNSLHRCSHRLQLRESINLWSSGLLHRLVDFTLCVELRPRHGTTGLQEFSGTKDFLWCLGYGGSHRSRSSGGSGREDRSFRRFARQYRRSLQRSRLLLRPKQFARCAHRVAHLFRANRFHQN